MKTFQLKVKQGIFLVLLFIGIFYFSIQGYINGTPTTLLKVIVLLLFVIPVLLPRWTNEKGEVMPWVSICLFGPAIVSVFSPIGNQIAFLIMDSPIGNKWELPIYLTDKGAFMIYLITFCSNIGLVIALNYFVHTKFKFNFSVKEVKEHS